jgi:serine protease Do
MKRLCSRSSVLAFILAPGVLSASAPQAVRGATRLADLDSELQALAMRVTPSVVQVVVSGFGTAPAGSASAVLAPRRGSGSGVVVDAGGYIVTSAHVVEGARRIEVMRSPRREGPGGSILRPATRPVPARLVGIDRETDLALIKVEAEGLVPIPFAEPEALRQGQLVLAFGSPLGLDDSVTMGVLSALARQLRPDDPMIYLQTDAPINPGSSGGPLVDVQGRLVGINTLILSQGGGNEGVGFAAPIHIVMAVVRGIKAEGRLRRGWIGARVQTVTPLIAAGLRLPSEAAVIVSDVVAESPAARVDLRVGDLVQVVDGRPVDNARQFDVRLYRAVLGETIKLEILRDGQRLVAEVPVVEKPGDPDRFASQVTPDKNLIPRLGILGIELDDEIRKLLPGLRGEVGVLVAARGGGAGGDDGLKVGDVVYALNGVSVRSLGELREAVARVQEGSALVLQVERDGKLHLVAIMAE